MKLSAYALVHRHIWCPLGGEIVINRSGAPLLFPEQDIGNNSDVSYILYLEQTVNLPCSWYTVPGTGIGNSITFMLFLVDWSRNNHYGIGYCWSAQHTIRVLTLQKVDISQETITILNLNNHVWTRKTVSCIMLIKLCAYLVKKINWYPILEPCYRNKKKIG